MFFDNRNIKKPVNAGESRISLQILTTVGYVTGLTRLLDTSPHTGIVGDKDDLERRRKVFGKHFIAQPTIESFFWVKLPRQFEDNNTIYLIWAATLYLAFGVFSNGSQTYIESLMIYFGVFFAAFIQAVCEYSKDKLWLNLQGEVNNQEITVYRGTGEARTTKVREIVVGDIIDVTAGNRIPADCILIEEMNITVD